MTLFLRPVSFNAAKKWVGANHRHSPMPNGWKFGAAIYEEDRQVGVVMAKPPAVPQLDDGFTLEIHRLCTDGTRNACSFGYAAMIRAAKALGFCKVITYTLDEESGASLKAVGFKVARRAASTDWIGKYGDKAYCRTSGTVRIRWELEWSEPPGPTPDTEVEQLHLIV